MSAVQSPMMDSLLRHMIELTGQRDHNLLDVAIISAVHEMLEASQVRVLDIVPSEEGDMLRPRAWIRHGEVMAQDDSGQPVAGGTPMSGYPVLIDCLAQRLNRIEETRADGEHVLWVPLWQGDKAPACLQIFSTAPFAASTLNMMEGILSVYRNYQNLLEYSERDSLTGLLNRRTFDDKFSRMVSFNRAADEEQAQSLERRHPGDLEGQWLAVVDIDHFKRVNDQYGHLYGDEVLILVANLLRSSFRTQDRVFRFGGEEFVVLLCSVSLTDARNAFERFRANIEAHYFPQVGTVTVSLGFVAITDETPVVVLGHADQALYYGKSNGRNQVCFYDELVEQGLLQSGVVNADAEFFFDDANDDQMR
ncbi:GGDEF domain-containing protein [Actimicrobium antarcticum]|uniref:diguanylate cyclase n=1 Tax=Actimicrobium antarcticum TaxID=1051899 RepID=A0ABP7TY55_9BURK